jgi:large subunit ribosomal protein L21
MYAVIRTGGKQYRVAPGDVIKVEKLAPEGGDFQFDDILAVSSDGKISPAGDAKVSARVLGEGRGEKILVFHYKRKKQYKKLQGHRQQYTAVRITEIAFDGQSFKAAEQATRAAKTPKVVEGGAAAEEAVAPKKKASAKKQASAHASGAGSKTAKGRGTSKSTKSKGGSSPKKK